MSYTEPTADAGQPQEGQAAEATPSVPYQEYLDRVPEEVRGDIAPIFHDWNSGINRRFEEHATYRKQWEPFEQIGLTQQSPEEVQWALQIAQAAQNDPQALREWLDQQYGPVEAQKIEQQIQDQTFETFDPSQQLDSKLDPILKRLEQFEQRWQEKEQAEQQAQIERQIDSEILKLKEEHAAHLPEKVQEQFKDIIERFGMKYAVPGAEPAQVVARAWADFEALSNQLGTAAIQQKIDQPQTPVTGGAVDLAPEAPKTLKEARGIALAQWRANNAA